MSSADGDPIEFLQNRLEEAYKEVKVASSQLAREARWKRRAAYALKGVTVFGGIAIAAGLHGIWSQGVGILIMVAAGADLLWSNHKRLLDLTEAQYAYDSLAESVEQTHTEQLAPIIAMKRNDAAKAAAQLSELLTKLIQTLNQNQTRIKAALRQSDLEALRALSIEQKSASEVSNKGTQQN